MTAPRIRVVITDCDHDSIAPEQAVAESHGIELVLAQCRTEEDVITAAADADAIVVQYAPISERVLDALPRLKAIGRYGVGVDTLDVPSATARGVAVCNVPDYGTEDVSDHAIALALNLTRGLSQLDRGTRRGEHTLQPVQPLHRIAGRVFGIVGLGRIGSATGHKALGLGYRVIGCDPTRHPGERTAGGIDVVPFAELLAQADVISLHVPLTEETRHLINAETLTAVKPGAVLVNTCRGGVVDTAALTDALKNGMLKGAGLDVFEEEPLPLTNPLVELENTVLTPHAAWYSEESYAELKRRAVENVIEVCAGRKPRNILNAEVLA
jgi:D-3-phosphoglycerate dehydrogenase